MTEPHDPYAALRYRAYRFLLSAGVLGSIGTQIQAVVVGWDIYERTESYADLGWAGLAEFFPVLLLSLPAGHAADRYSRRLLYQLAQLVICLGSVGLAALAYVKGPVPLIYACLVATGISRAISAPARQALLPQIVPPRVLPNAIAWNTSGWQIANVTGPALGGLVIFLTAENHVAYLLAAACSLLAGILATPVGAMLSRPELPGQSPSNSGRESMPPGQDPVGAMLSRPESTGQSPSSSRRESMPPGGARGRELPSLKSLLAGIRFVRQSKLLLAAITLDLFAVLLGGATALLPVYARDILKVGPAGLGWLRAAPAVGAFVMALHLAHRPPLRRPGPVLLLAVTGFGLAWVGFGVSVDPILSFIMLALTGALDNISVVIRHTLIQMLTPDEMRGRVSAVNLVFISSSNELGTFESGITAHWVGPVWSVVGGGAGTVLVVGIVMLCWPELVRLGPLHRVVATSPPAADDQRGTESLPEGGVELEKEA